MNGSLDDIVEISTPENVTFTFCLGGLGSRFVALLVDVLVQMVIVSGVGVALLIVGTGLSIAVEATAPKAVVASGIIMGVALSLFILSFFLIQWGYFVFFEVRRGGQTPGKRLMRLRVVRDEGQPVRFFDSVIRNVTRIADLLPATYMIGVISILASKRNKRVGDMAAGTIVVRETQTPVPACAARGTSLESEEAALVAEYLKRRGQMSAAGKLETARKLAVMAGAGEGEAEEALAGMIDTEETGC